VGKDNVHVVLDVTTPSGHLMNNMARTIVALTRAQVSMTIVGDAMAIVYAPGKSDHYGFKSIVNELHTLKYLVKTTQVSLEKAFPLKQIFVRLGLERADDR
jgi:hypothetical protein